MAFFMGPYIMGETWFRITPRIRGVLWYSRKPFMRAAAERLMPRQFTMSTTGVSVHSAISLVLSMILRLVPGFQRKAGQIAGAALDVTTPEPLPADDPLWDAPNIFITPHVAGQFHLPTVLTNIAAITADNLTRLQAGEPLRNLVEL